MAVGCHGLGSWGQALGVLLLGCPCLSVTMETNRVHSEDTSVF